MWFHSLLNSLKSRPSVAGVGRSSRRSTGRPQVEALEDRFLPSGYLTTDLVADQPGVAPDTPHWISDPVGDFLPTYTGPEDPGLDVTAHKVLLVENRMIFSGRMDGPIAPTQDIGGLYLFGLDRGQGTPRFLGGSPQIGPNVLWDSILRINPNGTGLFNNQVAGVVTPLNPADISINGNEFTASVPLTLLLPSATRPPAEWTYNLWPRNGVVIGQNQHVSDLAPDDGNARVQTVPPARVASVVVNDGPAQRSMVNSLTVTIDGPVTLDPGAFELSRQDGSSVELNVAASVVNGRTVAVLTFAGPDIVGASPADGSYTLTVRAERVHDQWGRAPDGDGNGSAGGDRAEAFFRLFGDSDGNGDVDWLDRDLFRSAFSKGIGDAG